MEKDNKKFIVNGIFLFILINAIVIAHQSFDIVSFTFVMKWYAITLLFTVVGFPLSLLLFGKFEDKGYIFTKVLGFLIPGYLMWLLSSMHILKFSHTNTLICLIVVGVISYALLIFKILKKKKKDEFITDIKSKLSMFYKLEVCFLLLFLVVCYVKAFNPAANSTEKYMDYGFMAVMNNADYMPSNDLWLAGEKINYYYFGHYICTYVTKLANIDVNFGYNLSITMLFTLMCFSAFSIVFNLLHYSNVKHKKIPYIGGGLSLLAVGFAGNFHYVIYNLIIPAFNTIFHIDSNYHYSFYDSTRYIGYNPDRVDKVIHEFPNFSFVLGDLHSHVININFVLLLLAILLAFVLNKKEIIDKINKGNMDIRKEASVKNVINAHNIFIGLLLGIFKMTNYWDFPIYFVVVMLIFFFSDLIVYKTAKDATLMCIFRLIIFLCVSSFISLPFTLLFVKIASKIALVPFRTLFYQLVVLWGLPTFLVLYYLLLTIVESLPIKFNKQIIVNYVSKLSATDLYALIIGFCAIGLVIAPEIIYVVDIYYDSIPRFNTVFKFTYQSFIMFGLCYGYMLVKLRYSERGVNNIVGKVLLIMFLLTCCYSYKAVFEWFGDITNKENYKSLDARQFLEYEDLDYDGISTRDNLNVINYINNNAAKDAVILEAVGDSFSSNNQISVFTGRQTLVGWTGHEWLWRSKNSSFDYPEILASHEDDVNILYHDRDVETLIDLIHNYNIQYIVIGYTERVKYSNDDFLLENEDILLSLGEVVLESNENEAKEPTYLIKINEDL